MINQASLGVRGSVEKVSGRMNKHYGLGQARYLGVAQMAMQLMLSAMALKLKEASLMAGG